MSISHDEALSFGRADQFYRTIRTGLRVAGWVFAAYIFRDSILLLAGQTTRLAIELSILGDLKFAVSISLAGVAAVWAVAERKLRHRKVANMQGRITDLEKRLDPMRSTSGLTPAGKTNPQDKG